MTHEAGHYMGLQHPWGLSGGCDDDDGVDDTPLQHSPGENCDLAASSCGSVDMTQNFMNIASDDCLTLFTQGQKEVVREVLTSIRAGLISHDKGRDDRVTSVHPDMESRYKVYLNPSFGGAFFLEGPVEKATLRLYDIAGRLVPFERKHTGKRMTITVHQKGFFLLCWEAREEKIMARLVNY